MTEHNIAVDTTSLKPEITLSTEDYAKLSALVRAAMNRMPELADGLSEELERAHIIEDEHFSTETVRMGCEVDFRDDTTGKTQNRDSGLSGASRYRPRGRYRFSLPSEPR